MNIDTIINRLSDTEKNAYIRRGLLADLSLAEHGTTLAVPGKVQATRKPQKLAVAPAKAKRQAKAAKRATAKGSARRGEKRSAEAIANAKLRILDFVKANPGANAEAIKVGTGLDGAVVNLPIKQLIAAKQLKKNGVKRATTYQITGRASNGALADAIG